MHIQVGDWVRSFSQGIWRIERIQVVNELPLYGSEPQNTRTFVVSKRLLNSKGKRSISMESCDINYIAPLSIEEASKLNNFIANNPKALKDFEQYDRAPDSVLNLSFSVPDEKLSDFATDVNLVFSKRIASGLTCDQILFLIECSEISVFYGKAPQNRTLQFISIHEEVLNQEYLFRNFNILDF